MDWKSMTAATVLAVASGAAALAQDDPIKIGVPVGLSGANSVVAPSVVQSSELAVEEINAQGGILGRQVELVIADDESGAQGAQRAFDSLVFQDEVDVLISMETSAARNAGLPIVNRSQTPYIYTSFYEGYSTATPPHRMAQNGIAYAPQEFTIFRDLTVEENLRLGVRSDRLFRDRVGLLDGLFPRLKERLRQRAGTLSGGEQKMLLISRAVLAKPRVMLIDEVSEGLQPTMVRRMSEILRQVRRTEGTAVLLVEQHLAFALSVADRYAVLKLGEIVEEGRAGDPSAAQTLSGHLKV